MIVIGHHVLLVDNWFADALVSLSAVDGPQAKTALYYSPLHIFFAGTEAVLVFFMLSGIVLVRTYPGLRSLTLRYFASRLARLYIPIWGSIVFALLLTFARPDYLPPGISWWLHGNYRTITGESVLLGGADLETLIVESAVLVNYQDLYSNWLNSSLWSMKIEIVASILLFIFVLGSRRPVIFLSAFALLVFSGQVPPVLQQYLQFLLFFAAGAWLAVTKFRPNRWQSDALVILAVTAFTLPWVLRGVSSPLASQQTELALGLVGAIALGFGVLGDSALRRVLEKRVFQHLGSRSYSIYLVHAPVVTLFGFWVVNLSGTIVHWFWFAPAAVLASLIAGEIFHHLVEKPALKLARMLKPA